MGDPDLVKTRATARDAVRQDWQQRRRPVVERRPSSVCHVMKRTWLQLWTELVTDGKQSSPPKETSVPRENGRVRENKQRETSPTHFPSVVSILQKNEIFRQVQTLQDDVTLKEVLSVLPTGYDWSKAIQETASRRSRAFWLWDLSVIVRNVVNLKKPGIRYVYDVHRSTNSDPILLKVLLRSKIVSLSTTTKWDLDRCRSILPGENTTFPGDLILDSATCCGKPDGYIRKWVRMSHGPLAVDGASEVFRIFATVERVRGRNSQTMEGNLSLRFSLRLAAGDLSVWKNTIEETVDAMKCCSGCLCGISLEVPINSRESFFHDVASLLSHMKDEDYDLVTKKLNIHLGGAVSDETDGLVPDFDVWLDTLSQHEDVAQITVDVTKLLVASAGALCTRVIGVREQALGGSIRRHYYIDDGCYGSLYAKDDSLTPLPLFAQNPSSDMCEATIWGPTCDGLDRVCQGIQLPALQRDDWLVFAGTNSSSEGLGTAFNGFNPPDTVYCVLGYFGDS